MPRLILHIGHFKTGTSAIQAWCHQHSGALFEQGFLYPAGARAQRNPTTHAALSLELFQQCGGTPPAWYIEREQPADFQAAVQALADEIALAPEHDVLVSSEEFWRLVELDDPLAARQHLLEAFPGLEPEVVMYVREPFDWLKSWYNQAQKNPAYKLNFLDYLQALPDSYIDPWINYRFWADAVGEAQVTVRTYAERGGAHIEGFLDACGVTGVTVGDIGSDPNPALDQAAMEAKRLAKIVGAVPLDRAGPLYQPGVLADSDALAILGERVERLSTVNQAFFAAHCGAAIAPLELNQLIVHHHQVHQLDPVLMLSHDMLKDADSVATTLRDIAINMEQADPAMSLELMEVAAKLRPGGKIIRRKLSEYREKLVDRRDD